jgi:hypothetical protein
MDMGDGCEIRFSTKRIVDSLFEKDKPLINEGFRWPIHWRYIDIPSSVLWGIHLFPLGIKHGNGSVERIRQRTRGFSPGMVTDAKNMGYSVVCFFKMHFIDFIKDHGTRIQA